VSDNESPEISSGATVQLDAAELGGVLRETRTALHRELNDVASELRIRLVYLEAIEEGRLDRLPGPAYASGFLRAYGDYLGLDGEDLVTKFKLAGGVGEGRMDLQLPSPVEEGRLPTGSIFLVAALLAIGAYGGWYYLSSQGRDPMQFVASLPDNLVALVSQSEVTPPASRVESGSNQGAAAATPDPNQSGEAPQISSGTNSAPPMQRSAEAAAPAVNSADAASQAGPDETAVERDVASASAAPEPSAVPMVPEVPAATPQRVAEIPASAPPVISPAPPAEAKIPEPMTPRPSVPEAPRVAENPDPANSRGEAPAASLETAGRTEPATPVASRAPAGDEISDNGIANVVVAKTVAKTIPVQQAREVSVVPAATTAGSNRVVVRATADSWVEVRSGSENPVLSKVLRAGEVYRVPSRPGLKLATGNAGGIEIVVNGRALPVLGPVGAVRRNVALDAESLLSLTVPAR
jgi:cytoskeleton protein RodZ